MSGRQRLLPQDLEDIYNVLLAIKDVDGIKKIQDAITAVVSGEVDVTDRWDRELGQVDLVRVLNNTLTAANPVIAGIFDAAGNRMPSMDAVARPGYVDVIDRAARLLGIVYGDQGQLAQRPISLDLYVQLRHLGASIDPRDRNWTLGVGDTPGRSWNLGSGVDSVSALQATRTSLKVQGEREDLVQGETDVVAAGAGNTQLLAAVGGQKHKIYACGYESDTAVQCGFRFGAAGNRWGRRITKGVYAQTFTHPQVSAVNTVFNFYTSGAVNAYVWYEYITEA